MVASPFRFVPSLTEGYDVYRRSDGKLLGYVIQREQSYNIAPRALTVRYWLAYQTPGRHKPLPVHYSKRIEAAQALEDHR